MSPRSQPKYDPDNTEQSPLSGLSAGNAPRPCGDTIRIVLPQQALHEVRNFAVDAQPGAQESLVALPASFAASKKGREQLKSVMFESLVSDLGAYARSGVLPQGSRERLSTLAGIILGKESITDYDLRTATSTAAVSMREGIAERAKKAFRSLSRLSPTSSLSCSKSAASTTRDTIAALCELRALSWLAPESLSHSSFCERGQPGLAALCAVLENTVDAALAKADFGEAESVVSIQSEILSLLQNGRLDRSQPSFLVPLPITSKGSATAGEASLAALLKSAGNGGGYSTFAPPLRRSLPIAITAQLRAAESLKAAKAWQTEDESPAQELLEGLIDALPLAATELVLLKPAEAPDIPPGLASVVSILSRVRYQGTNDGLASFTTMLGPPEDNSRLVAQAEYYAQQHTHSWMKLVKLVSSWPDRSPAARQESWSMVGPELTATVARGLWMITSTFGASALKLLQERTFGAAASLAGLVSDVQNLSCGAEALASHPESLHVAPLMRAIVDELAPSVVRALEALMEPEHSARGLLEKVQSLPTEFGQNDLEKELQKFCEHARASAAETFDGASIAAIESLSSSYSTGDVDAFVDELNRFLALAGAVPEGSPVMTQHLQAVHRLTGNYINLITEGFNTEVECADTLLAKAEALRAQLAYFALLKEVFRTHGKVIDPSLTNHLDRQVIAALNASHSVSEKFLQALCDELSRATAPDSSVRLAKLLTNTTGSLRKLSSAVPHLVARFRAVKTH